MPDFERLSRFPESGTLVRHKSPKLEILHDTRDIDGALD
jgi:hypothetical protein